MLKEELEYTQLLDSKNNYIINMIWDSGASKLIVEDTIKQFIREYNTKDQTIETFLNYVYEEDKYKIKSIFNENLEKDYLNNNKIQVMFKIRNNENIYYDMVFTGDILKNNDNYYLIGSSCFKSSIDDEARKYKMHKLNDIKFIENKKNRYTDKFDTITGLCNEYYFKEIVSKFLKNIKEKNQRAALIVIDLDDFKYVNDSFGHDFGDILLKEVGNIIMNVIPRNGVACRYSGDTFILFIPNIESKKDISKIAENIYSALDKPNPIKNNIIYLTTSIGAALFPEHGIDYLSLLKNADAAMYEAKKNNKKECEFFDNSFSDKVNRIYSLQKGLRTALENKEIYVVFQPKVSFEDSKVNGFEALVRWKSEKFGNVSPVEFIPIAENSKMIIKIGSYVLEEVFRKIKFLLSEGKTNFKIAVNLSEMQLREDVILLDLKRLLKEYKISPKYIEVEITESMLMKSFEKNVKILEEIKSLGISIALDDFGTGYSSLNYLTKLPIDVLKIDRSFVIDLMNSPKSRCIVENIINLSHQLGIEVVAEGIEEKYQVEYLKEILCDIGQGYYYSKPRSFKEIVNIIGKMI